MQKVLYSRMRKQPNSELGFSLIELLVVISIIGLLASIVLLGLNTARKKARETNTISNLQQISKAMSLYYLANNAYPTGTFISTDPANWAALAATLKPYLVSLPQPAVPEAYFFFVSNWYIFTDTDGVTKCYQAKQPGQGQSLALWVEFPEPNDFSKKDNGISQLSYEIYLGNYSRGVYSAANGGTCN